MPINLANTHMNDDNAQNQNNHITISPTPAPTPEQNGWDNMLVKFDSDIHRVTSPLGAPYYRANRRPQIVIHKNDTKAEVRVWGNAELLNQPITINGVSVQLKPWRTKAYRATISLDQAQLMLADPNVDETDLMEPEPRVYVPNPLVTRGLVAFSTETVAIALVRYTRLAPRFFSRTSMDSSIIALTYAGAMAFLEEDLTDSRNYVDESEGRNYDCDDFATSVRSKLNERYGCNSVGIIAGNVHAWNFFVVISDSGEPQIIPFEPQTDELIDMQKSTNPLYDISTRFEVII